MKSGTEAGLVAAFAAALAAADAAAALRTTGLRAAGLLVTEVVDLAAGLAAVLTDGVRVEVLAEVVMFLSCHWQSQKAEQAD